MGEERDSGYRLARPNSDDETLFDGAAPYVRPVGDAPVVEMPFGGDSPLQQRFVFMGDTELDADRGYRSQD